MDAQQSGQGPSESDSEQRTSVTIRRAPKLPVFAVLGALVGFLASLILTSAFEIDPAVGFGATLGYLALYAIPLGVVLGVVVALLLDGRASRRATQVIAGKLDVSSGDAADGTNSERDSSS